MAALLKPLRLDIDNVGGLSPLPLSLSLAKSHCAIDTTDFDTLLNTYILAAIEWAEGATHRTIYSRSHVWVLADFPRGADQAIRLPRGKTQSVESIVYIDSDGNSQTLTGPSSAVAGTDYREDLRGDDGGTVMPALDDDWPEAETDHPSPVVITFTAGWLDAQVPQQMVHALLFAVSDAFDMRGAADLKDSGQSLRVRESIVSPYRLVRWY